MAAEVIAWAVWPLTAAGGLIGWRYCTGRWPQCFRRWLRWALWKAAGSPEWYSLGRYDAAQVAAMEAELERATKRYPIDPALASGHITINQYRERAGLPPYKPGGPVHAPATHITVLMNPNGLVFLED